MAPPPGPRPLLASPPPGPARRPQKSRDHCTTSRLGAGPSGARTLVAGVRCTPGRRSRPPQRRGLARLPGKHPPNGDPRRVRGGAAVPPGPPAPSLRRTQVRQSAAGESRPRSRSCRWLPARGLSATASASPEIGWAQRSGLRLRAALRTRPSPPQGPAVASPAEGACGSVRA